MLRVTEATFSRHVLRAALPVLVCFGTRACPGRQALLPGLRQIAAAYRKQLLVAAALVDDTPLLAEQYAVSASPTMIAFQHGEPQARAIGFLPSGLLELFAAAVAEGGLANDRLWSPTEERLEDVVLIPLLQSCGFTVQRQAACRMAGRERPQRGRIDLLVFAQPEAPPITLIESKRQIFGSRDLQQAGSQAAAYAQSLSLPSFVVAAPQGLWFYRHGGAAFSCVQHVRSIELHQQPERARQLFLQLAYSCEHNR